VPGGAVLHRPHQEGFDVTSHPLIWRAADGGPRIDRVPGLLSVAVAQPPCVAHDVAANARAHAAAIRDAGARVVVFPELSLTGYELDAAPVDPADPRLAPITGACARTGTVALAGAPVAGPDGAVSTVTVASAEMTLPSDAVANAVTVVCPIPTPATSPVEFTVAT